MVTQKQFREALQIIADYERQVIESKTTNKYPNQIGCRVKLSKFGKEMQKPHNYEGIVIDYLEGVYSNDGLVTVKWEGITKPVIMHVHQVEAIKVSGLAIDATTLK